MSKYALQLVTYLPCMHATTKCLWENKYITNYARGLLDCVHCTPKIGALLYIYLTFYYRVTIMHTLLRS